MKFVTRQDAQTYVDNTGPGMWDDDGWGGESSATGWADWLWQNRDHAPATEREFREALSEYLLSVGEDPADYSL